VPFWTRRMAVGLQIMPVLVLSSQTLAYICRTLRSGHLRQALVVKYIGFRLSVMHVQLKLKLKLKYL